MREMIFINCVPDDLYFSWQEEVFIENVRSLGYTQEIRILVFLPQDRLSAGFNPRWKVLVDRYADQNVKFWFYPDHGNLMAKVQQIQYIPLLRPYMLQLHFYQYPELYDKAIFYHDSDIVFTKYLDFTPYLEDDTCYLSDTKSYLNSDYFDSKRNDVLPHLREEYDKIDVLEATATMFGIDRATCEKNKDATGGAQYLLKNIDATFWEDVLKGCMDVRRLMFFNLGGINRTFFASENAGFQSWCADMWSVLYNLWKRNLVTKTPPEFDFAWATDGTARWEQVYMYHDAGVGGGNESFLFNKRKQAYIDNVLTPFTDDLSYVSPDYASSLYVKEILKVKDKYYSSGT